jgi:hypothetical protein
LGSSLSSNTEGFRLSRRCKYWWKLVLHPFGDQGKRVSFRVRVGVIERFQRARNLELTLHRFAEDADLPIFFDGEARVVADHDVSR